MYRCSRFLHDCETSGEVRSPPPQGDGTMSVTFEMRRSIRLLLSRRPKNAWRVGGQTSTTSPDPQIHVKGFPLAMNALSARAGCMGLSPGRRGRKGKEGALMEIEKFFRTGKKPPEIFSKVQFSCRLRMHTSERYLLIRDAYYKINAVSNTPFKVTGFSFLHVTVFLLSVEAGNRL